MSAIRPKNKLLSTHPGSNHHNFSLKTDELFRQALDCLARELDASNRQEVVYEAVFRLAERTFDLENKLPTRSSMERIRDAETIMQIRSEQALVKSFHERAMK